MGRWTVVPVFTTVPVVRESGLRRSVGSTERARAAVASLGPEEDQKQRLHPGVLSVTSKSPAKKSHD